ncbi:MAG: hypothetical protein ACC662_11475, partial [Planctomycetota bacterium]
SLDGEVRAKAEYLVFFTRCELAVHDGELETARALWKRVQETWGKIPEPRVHAYLKGLETDLLRAEGRCEEAMQALEQGLETPGIPLPPELDLLVHRVRTLSRLERRGAAVRAAERALERLEEVRGDASLVAETSEYGIELAAYLHDAGAHDLAARAYDLAASAILERIRQLDACMRDLPELSTTTDEDLDWLRDLQSRQRARQRDLLDRVGALLQEARRDGTSPFHDEATTNDLVRLCAWCGRVVTRGGNWLPVAHYIPESAGVRVTHTICPRCMTRVGSAG